MSIASAKMPVAVVSGAICLMLGIGGGLVLGSYVDTGLNPKTAAGGESAETKDAGKLGMAPGGGMPGGKGGGGAPGGKAGGGGGKGPSPKVQLAQLVGKLETLAAKPIALELTPAQKKSVQAVLADLDAKDAIGDEDAKAKFDQLVKLLENQKAALEAAGFRWPGSQPVPQADLPNPYKEGDGAAKLKSLRESLGK